MAAAVADADSDRPRKIANSLVSGSYKIGSPDELKVIARLFVKTGGNGIRSSSSSNSSDVWHYFGPLYREHTQCLSILSIVVDRYSKTLRHMSHLV